MRKTARPTLTEKVIESTAQYLAMGMPVEKAARLSGISPSVFYKWQAIGRDEEERRLNGERADRKLDLYVQFVEGIEKGRGAFVARNLARIDKAAEDGNWQAAAWSLERRYPKDFGRVSRTELTGADGGPVRQETTVVSDAELARLADEIAGLGPIIPKPEQ